LRSNPWKMNPWKMKIPWKILKTESFETPRLEPSESLILENRSASSENLISRPRIRIQGLDSKESIFKDSISRIRPQGFDFQGFNPKDSSVGARPCPPAPSGAGTACPPAGPRSRRHRSAARAAGPTTVRPPEAPLAAARGAEIASSCRTLRASASRASRI
jgi:hypothetical protein